MKILLNKHRRPEVDLAPDTILNSDGWVKHLVFDNKSMSFNLKELVHNFTNENINEVSEYGTPGDAVHLVAKLFFLPVVNEIESVAYFHYNGAGGASSNPSHLKRNGGNTRLISSRKAAST